MPILLPLLLATAAHVSSEGPPARAGACGWVHGRFAIYNGSGVRRIWVIGTKRILALDDDDNFIPSQIAFYQRHATEHLGKSDGLFGDFYVCARESSRAGWMQHIRLLRTRNLLYRGFPFQVP